MTLWWLLTTYPARPSARPSTSSEAHSGRSRSKGPAAKSPATSSSWRMEPGAGSLTRCTCSDNSKLSSVTQVGVPSANAGSTTRCRIRGTIRVAHSCAASSRSQSGVGSSNSSRLTLTRSRGSADSARHMAVSSGLIWAELPHSSGIAGGGPEPATAGGAPPAGAAAAPEPADAMALTCRWPSAGQLASVARYCPRTS